MTAMLKSQLMSVQMQQVTRKPKKKPDDKPTGISKYLSEDTSSEEDDEFDNGDDALSGAEKSIRVAGNKEQLIDQELVNLLKYCQDLFEKHKNSDDYQEEIMLKSVELGKKTKQKLLILDMDETMVAARFNQKLPEGFITDFKFPY